MNISLGVIHKPRGQLRGRGLVKWLFSKSDHEGRVKIFKNLTTWFMDDPYGSSIIMVCDLREEKSKLNMENVKSMETKVFYLV